MAQAEQKPKRGRKNEKDLRIFVPSSAYAQGANGLPTPPAELDSCRRRGVELSDDDRVSLMRLTVF